MSLHVRHTAKCSAEHHVLLSLLPVLLLVIIAIATPLQIKYPGTQQKSDTPIAIALPHSEPEEEYELADIRLPEPPSPPTLFEPDSPSYAAEYDFSDEGIPLPPPEENDFAAFAEFSPIELPEEDAAPTHKAAPKKQAAIKLNYTPPRYESTPQPPYPAELQRQKLSGSVRVRIRINMQGKPTRIEIINSTHPAFAKSAQQTIMRSWRFAPAQEGNKPVEASVTTTVYFKV